MALELVETKKIYGSTNKESPEKTLFLFNKNDFTRPFFFEIIGNYSHLNNVQINDYNCKQQLQNELDSLIFDFSGKFKSDICKLDKPTFDWKHFCNCGVL